MVHPHWWQGWPWPLECWRCLLWKDIASLKCSSVLLQEEMLESPCLSPEFHPPWAGHHEVGPWFLPTLVQWVRRKLCPLHLWLVQGFQWLISEKIEMPWTDSVGMFSGEISYRFNVLWKNPHLKKMWEIPTTFKADSTSQCREKLNIWPQDFQQKWQPRNLRYGNTGGSKISQHCREAKFLTQPHNQKDKSIKDLETATCNE